MGRNISQLMSATMLFAEIVGWRAKYSEPRSPFSSPVTTTNRMDRRVLTAASFRWAATSRIVGHSGGVVHRAVEDGIAVYGFADSQMVNVGGENHVFVFQAGIASGIKPAAIFCDSTFARDSLRSSF